MGRKEALLKAQKAAAAKKAAAEKIAKTKVQACQLGNSGVNPEGRCGTAFNNSRCHDKLFCSMWGWCGSGKAWQYVPNKRYWGCGAKVKKLCEWNRTSTNGRCGPSFGNTKCGGGYCSAYGWCGSGAAWMYTPFRQYWASNVC